MSRQSALEMEVHVWRYTLANNKPLATGVIERVAKKLKGSPSSDRFLYNRAISRLKNGVETPQDYGVHY